jgi:hypothetical protein
MSAIHRSNLTIYFYEDKNESVQEFSYPICCKLNQMKYRKIVQTVKGVQTMDGAGVRLTRIIGSPEMNMLDPFLLLDEFGSDNPDDYKEGFPPHPHRGFETITYILNGKWHHKDSAGNEGLLEDGSVQWMTAGKGIIHSEMPIQKNGLARGFQLWLNLPKRLKMTEPNYQDIPKEKIPVIEIIGGNVKVISGDFNGTTGPGKSHTELLYVDICLKPEKEFFIKIPNGWNCFSYIYDGYLEKPEQLFQGELQVYEKKGDIQLKSGKTGLQAILVAGEPLCEPVARGGPFVMNTKGEVLKAFEDYQKGVLA